MMKASSLFLSLPIIFSAVASAQSGSTTTRDGFENGLGNWHPKDDKIEIVQNNCAEGQKCVRIERGDSRGYTFIGRKFQVPSAGSLRFQAKIRCEGVAAGSKEYHRGKFVAVVMKNGKEVDWPDADFIGNIPDWQTRSVDVADVDPSMEIDVRIGLQNVKGVVYVDDFKAEFTPAK